MSEPIYPKLLGLRHIAPNAWQRALLGEGMIAAGVLLSLADLASAWSIVVLPVAMGLVVKAHDVVTGLVGGRPVAASVEPTADRTADLTVDDVPVRLKLPGVLTEAERADAVHLAVRLAGYGEAPEHTRPTSAALWALVEQARAEAADGDLPFLLVTSPRGPVRVGADLGGLLTSREQAGALRVGLRASQPDAAVLVYEAGDGLQLAAYEAGVGVLLDEDLQVLTAELPPP